MLQKEENISKVDLLKRIEDLESKLTVLQERLSDSDDASSKICPSCGGWWGTPYKGVYKDEFDFHCTQCGHNFK